MRLMAGKETEMPSKRQERPITGKKMDRTNWEKETKCWERHAQHPWTGGAEKHRPWGFTGSADSAIGILITYRPTGCFSSANPMLTVHTDTHTCLTDPLAVDIKRSHVNTGLHAQATSHTPQLGAWHTIYKYIWRIFVCDRLKGGLYWFVWLASWS